jgi:hypothetical protein
MPNAYQPAQAPVYAQRPTYSAGYGYEQHVNTYQPQVPVQPQADFEPDDPIPETAEQPQEPAKRRHPKFVDFFIRKGDKK